MKKLFYFLFFYITANIINAQIPSGDFTGIQSEGPIPADFKMIMEGNIKNADYLYLQDLFQSGQLVYGSAVNQYIDRIMDNLLAEYPGLQKEVRAYVVKSTEVNAYASPTGMIFVNMGLIAQVTNEGELAFILAHEIAHYAEKHSYQQKQQRDRDKSKSLKEAVLSYTTRSREMENEADRLALERYFKNSPYSYAVIDGVFDVLQYNYLPFDEVTFRRGYFETEFYQFPDNYFLTTTTPIRSRDDYIDTLRTHPNIKKRRENAMRFISNVDNEGRKIFVQSEELFEEIRKLARFECINTFLTEHEFADAVYNIYYLQYLYPDNRFLDIAMASALYGLSKHKLNSNFSKVVEPFKNIEGEKQQVNHFLSKLSRQELNLLALRFLWEIHKKEPDNNFIILMCRDVAKDLVLTNKMKYTDFSDYYMNSNPDEIKEDLPDQDSTLLQGNKYQRIRQQNAASKNKIKPDEKFKTANYMLVDLRQDAEFMALLDEIEREKEDRDIKIILQDKPKSVQLDSLVALRPVLHTYMKGKDTKSIDREFARRHHQRLKLDNTIRYSLNKLDYDYLFYSSGKISGFDTEEYNIYCSLQSWKAEFIFAGSTEMVLYNCRNMEELTAETGFDKINFILVYTEPISFITGGKITSLIFYPAISLITLPGVITSFALPRYLSQVFFYVGDLKTGKTLMDNRLQARSAMKEAYIDSFIYDSFYQLKKGK